MKIRFIKDFQYRQFYWIGNTKGYSIRMICKGKIHDTDDDLAKLFIIKRYAEEIPENNKFKVCPCCGSKNNTV